MLPTLSVLYKYMAPDRIDVLESGLIRFTQPDALNDPFELKPVFQSIFPEEGAERFITPSVEDLELAIRRLWATLPADKTSQVSADDAVAWVKRNPEELSYLLGKKVAIAVSALRTMGPRAREDMAKLMAKELGVLSLSEVNDCPLMWAHYADSHRGFVIEFDAQHRFFDRRRSEGDELYHLREVRYISPKDRPKSLSEMSGADLFSVKSESWKYEREWRFVSLLKDANSVRFIDGDEIHLFDFPRESVVRVILGSRASQQMAAKVKGLVHQWYPAAKVGKARLCSVEQRILIEDC